MRIYTRSGDDGSTSLIHGRRTNKDDLRVEAYGTVDEANSAIGFASSLLPADERWNDLKSLVVRLQRDLFDVGRDLATPDDKRDQVFIRETDVSLLESCIDTLDAELPGLTKFILPGGHPAASAFQIARTVVRRAERLVVHLGREQFVQPADRRYLNRLSDLLFVVARVINHRLNEEEPWVDFQAEKPLPWADK